MIHLQRFLIALVFASSVRIVAAVDYPYSNIAPQSATLSIDTSNPTPFNNRLLGLNTNFPENQYGLDGYNDADGQSLITQWSPPVLRFPHGVWANFYDWEVDGRRIYDDYDTIYRPAVENVPQLKYGFDGFKILHDNLGFDVLHTWNVNYDSPGKGVLRLLDRQAKGLAVNRIELGNEIFWVNQRSNATATPELYVAVAASHSSALKTVDPNIQLSVPVSWRTTGHHVPWNAALAADQSYYDAVSLHKYIRPGVPTVAGLQEVLDARSQMIQTAEATRAQFPNKPIWLSEWSVDAGENAISVLGLSDTYLGIIDRPDLFGSAEYFQIHNHDPFVLYDKTANPKYVKTTRGAAYDILRSVFLDSDLVSETMTSTQITPGVDAVTAKAVLKNGDVVVYVVNKSPVSVPLNLSIDGGSISGAYVHEALQFNTVDDFPTFNLSASALTSIPSTSGSIDLPPLSISVLSGFTTTVPEVVAGWDNFDNPSTPSATTVAAGVTATASVTGPGWVINDGSGRGSSKDTTWGTLTNSVSADAGTTALGANLTLVNGSATGDLTFTITNSGSADFDLNAFHMDALAFRPNAARSYALNVLSGDITVGNVFSSAAPTGDNSTNAITHLAGGLLTDDSDPLTHDQHEDINISLSGLADHTLEVGETAVIQIAFTGGEGSGGGHHLFVDNVAFSGVSDTTTVLLGDCNLDGTVNFLDISPFIFALSSGSYLAQADCDQNGAVNFLDIAAFIAILSST